MSSLRGAHKEDRDRRDDDNERYSRRRRSRSHSRQRRHERHNTRSRTPERQHYSGKRSSRTPERRRRSRSHEGGGENSRRRERHYSARRHKDSRSRSRSSTRHAQHHGGGLSGNAGSNHRRHSRDRQSYAHRKDTNNSLTSSAGIDNALINKRGISGAGDSNMTPFDSVGAYYNLDTDEPFDKARIHREMEAKLRETLAREGKVYPPPKAEASHPVFANDGSFLELFKKMQQQQHPTANSSSTNATSATTNTTTAAAATIAPGTGMTGSTSVCQQSAQHNQLPPIPSNINMVTTATAAGNVGSNVGSAYMSAHKSVTTPQPPPPIVGRRRGGKILKTGVVAKQKAQTEDNADPKDFWSLYLAEVNKYKSNACESDGGKRPLVK